MIGLIILKIEKVRCHFELTYPLHSAKESKIDSLLLTMGPNPLWFRILNNMLCLFSNNIFWYRRSGSTGAYCIMMSHFELCYEIEIWKIFFEMRFENEFGFTVHQAFQCIVKCAFRRLERLPCWENSKWVKISFVHNKKPLGLEL